jgi:alpha-amylase
MSSFKFTGMDDSIPETAIWQNGRNTCLDKNSPWVSQHRWSAISNMVLFRNKTKQAQGISHIWLNGDQIAFARTVQKSREYVTTLGFVVINNTDQPLKKRFETGLPAGKYFNLVMSQFNKDGKMEGVTVDVENYGFSTIEVMPYNAVVLLLNYLI